MITILGYALFIATLVFGIVEYRAIKYRAALHEEFLKKLKSGSKPESKD